MNFLSKKNFDSSKCVSLLELIPKRIKILKNKRSIIAKQSRDDVAKLLQKGQDANAAARAEHVFREENIVAAYDILERDCQLLIKRINAIKSQKECPSELKEAIANLIYAAPRCGDLQELQKIRDIFTSKYGADYSVAILELRPECAVNAQIIQKLSSRPPNSDIRLNLLKEIATEYNINWNYQKAVAASLKNGETSQGKPKVSTSASQASKGATPTVVGNEKPLTPVFVHQEEQKSAAAQNAIHSKEKYAGSEPRDFERANQASDVARHADEQKPTFTSSDHDGHKGQVSSAAQNIAPSTPHDIGPGPQDLVGARKRSNVVTPTRVDGNKPHHVPIHHDRVKEQESSPAHEAVPSAMNRSIPRQKDFMGASQISDIGLSATADKQKPISMPTHWNELNGQPSLAASNALPSPKRGFASASQVSDVGAPASVKPASVFLHQDEITEKATSASHNAIPSTACNNALRPKSSVNPIQMSNVNMHKSPEKRKPDVNRVKGQATSTPPYYQAKAFSPKEAPHPITNHMTDASAESLAAKQYMSAYKSYVKVDTAGGEQDLISKDNPQANLKQNRGTRSPTVDPYALLKQEGKMDYRNVSHFYEQAQEPKGSQAMDGEEDTIAYEYYAREQMKGSHHRRVPNAQSYEGSSFPQMSIERGGGKNAFNFQARHQLDESLLDYQKKNPSTLPEVSKGLATRSATSLAHQELRTGRMRAEDELLDLAAESAFVSESRAADAAKAAIDMVRTSSGRSRGDKKMVDVKGFQREQGFGRADAAYSVAHHQTVGRSWGLNSDSINDEPERMQYRHRSSHPEMLSRKGEIRATPHVQKKMVVVGTQDSELEAEVADREFESRKMSYDTSTRKKQGHFKDTVNVGVQRKQESNLDHTEPYQDQERFFHDAEILHFDDYYSSDESSVEEPPLYNKGREATRKDDAQVNKREALSKPKKSGSTFLGPGSDHFMKESLRLSPITNLQQNFSDGAESVDLLSPKSSCSSYQLSNSEIFPVQSTVQHPQFDEYEESGHVPMWSSTPPMRSHVSGMNTRITNGGPNISHNDTRTHHREQQWYSSTSNEDADNGALKWRASVPEGRANQTLDASKKRWTSRASEEVKPPLQAHIRASQHDHNPAITSQDTQAATGKVQGLSRRTVRP